MEEKGFTVTNKEIFYTALMLGSERLIGVEYDFPLDDALLTQELGEVKRGLHKRKLLRENSKGEITLADELSAVAAFCSEPDECVIIEETALKGTVYKVGVSSLFLETVDDNQYSAFIFAADKPFNEYINSRLQAGKGAVTGG
jgi:hypothetical protein